MQKEAKSVVNKNQNLILLLMFGFIKLKKHTSLSLH